MRVFSGSIYVYTYIWPKKSASDRRLRQAMYAVRHAVPARVAELAAQGPLRLLPMRPGKGQAPFPFRRQTEATLPPVLSPPHAHPPCLTHGTEGPRQRGAVHRQAGAERLLIRHPELRERGKQTELRDFEARLSQFLVVEARHDAREAAQVLTGARQGEQHIPGDSLAGL